MIKPKTVIEMMAVFSSHFYMSIFLLKNLIFIVKGKNNETFRVRSVSL